MAALSQGTYKPVGTNVLAQKFNEVSTTQHHQLGERQKGFNVDDGVAEFIYLKGVSGLTLGMWVTYNTDDWSTTLLAANAIGPVAIAYSLADANTDYGWFMIHGKADAAAKDVADNGKVYIDTTSGYCDDAVVAGDKVHNAKWASADDTGVGSAGHAEVEIAYPFCTDEST